MGFREHLSFTGLTWAGRYSRSPSQLDRSGLRVSWPLFSFSTLHTPPLWNCCLCSGRPSAQLCPHAQECPQALFVPSLMAWSLVPECRSHHMVGGNTGRGGGGLWFMGVPAGQTNLPSLHAQLPHPVTTPRLSWENCSTRFILGFRTLVICHFYRSQGSPHLMPLLASLPPWRPTLLFRQLRGTPGVGRCGEAGPWHQQGSPEYPVGGSIGVAR